MGKIITEVIVQGLRFIAAHIAPAPSREFLRRFDLELKAIAPPFYIALERDNSPLQRFAERRGARFLCWHGKHWIGLKNV